MNGSAEKPSVPGSYRKRILYVVQEYPVITQTFVENEALAVQECGVDVSIFAIHSKSFGPNRISELINFRKIAESPKMWPHLLSAVYSAATRTRNVIAIFLCGRTTFRSVARMSYAFILSLALVAYLKSQDQQINHLHAHFLGRTLDVVSFVKTIYPHIRVSATAHAADASNPESMERLRKEVGLLDDVVSASESVARALLESTGRDSTEVIHCGINPKNRHSFHESSRSAGFLHILSVGRTVEKKGYDDCIVAARELANMGLAFEWRIVGSGPLDGHLHDLSSDLINSGHIIWLGSKSNDFVLDLLSSWADIFVLPSKLSATGDLDGIPVAIMEAMTHSVVPISTRLSGIPELIIDGDTGLLIEPSDINGLISSIELLSINFQLRERLGLQAKAFVDRYFNQKFEAQKLVDRIFSPSEF